MKLKDTSVNLNGVSSAMLYALSVVDAIYLKHTGEECVLTSCKDGKHKEDSLHYEGEAGDIRTRTVPQNVLPLIVDQIRAKLGAAYDVILEDTHLHIEHDPKG